MSRVLPPLRAGLDVMPSPVPEQPGLLLRDPFRYTDTVLIIPPVWVLVLPLFDGEHTDLEALEAIYKRTGHMAPKDSINHLIDTLKDEGFLETEEFVARREKCHRQFAEAPERLPAHSGSGYPADAAGVNEILKGYFDQSPICNLQSAILGIAAPHVSPSGGWNSYAAAYRSLTPDLADRTFVLLGTSHYGEPERFGLTAKPYVTPLGKTEVDRVLHDCLAAAAPGSVILEDYCHSIEHSIEFQVLFLQYVMNRPVKVLPVLCGAFVESLLGRGAPETNDTVRRFFDALGEIAAREGDRLFWLLGIDMAHMGRRYGDDFEATADQGQMQEVATRDRLRMESVCAGDAAAFFHQVAPNGDDLKWCGYSALYTFLKAVPNLRGEVLRYEQWNIDPASVVSFAGMAFARNAG
jgi:hypothetical protein